MAAGSAGGITMVIISKAFMAISPGVIPRDAYKVKGNEIIKLTKK